MSLETLLASLAPDGRDFESLCKWLLETLPEYRTRVERVWLWKDWPGREGRPDAGIDLVARERDGGLWAIQAKQYNPAYAIKKADLDSFLSESSRPKFAYRLLIATTDHLGPTARRTLDHQEKPVGTILRSDLAAIEIAWPRSIERLSPPRAKPKKPRPHQRRAVGDVIAGLAVRDRGQLVMACGTGKTLAARFLHDELGAQRTLVLVPSLSLVKQTIREWFSVGDFDYLAVCSDDTVATQDRDAVVASTSELGVPVTTDAEEIAAFLRRRSSRPRVVFATYQSSQRIADAQAGRTPLFDLVVADEAHRCAGREAGVFATVLDPAKIRARKRLYMTATPRYYTGRLRKEASEADWEIASMDDEQKFGPVLHRLTFAQAIENDLLCDYQVVVVGVSDSSFKEMAERAAFVTADGETITDARTLASQLGLLRAMRNHDLHRVVSFHSRIANARSFATTLHEVRAWMPPHRRPSGKLWTQHVSGEMTSGERETRLNQLRDVGSGERGVLTNARCLTEGVDVPTLDGVAFIEPRRSQVDIVQAVGRAMRMADDKTVGTIVIPVFVDENADPEQALDSSEFDRVWQVVKALRAHDDVLAEELDELRRGQWQRKTSMGRPAKIMLDLPLGVGVAFARAFDTRVVEASTATWDFWFGLLCAFVEREGHARVERDQVEGGYPLGKWVGGQRSVYRAGNMRRDRARRLDSFPGWTWRPRRSLWETHFALLHQFVAREGHAVVPRPHVEDGYYLGRWVSMQRSRYRSRLNLREEQIRRLEALRGWTWNTKENAWEETFSVLESFVVREGHAAVPSGHVEGDSAVGKWVTKQRMLQTRGALDEAREVRLSTLPGWVWDARRAKWERGYVALLQFVRREGHALVPADRYEGSRALGQWVTAQRANRFRISTERRERLESVGGWSWSALDDQWERAFQLLSQFVDRERDGVVPANHDEGGFLLGAWVRIQRKAAVNGTLDPTRRARLQSVPGWVWDTSPSATWEVGFSHLQEHADRFGTARVAADYTEAGGYELRRWCAKQRFRHSRGELPPDQAERLSALSGWWWSSSNREKWDESFELLARYARRMGDSWPPIGHSEDGFALGKWVSRQRQQHARGVMTDGRIARLEALPGWEWSRK